MTRPEYPGGGVDLDLLADYASGALDGTPEERAVARLIATDPSWERGYAQLVAATEAVRADLAGLGSVGSIPADVAARLDAALAAAQPTTASPDPAGTPARAGGGAVTRPPAGAAGPRRPGRGSRRAATEPGRAGQRRWRRWAGPVVLAAGVLAITGIGAAVVWPDRAGVQDTAINSAPDRPAAPQGERPGQPEQPRAATGAGENGGSAAVLRATGTDYQRDTLTGSRPGVRPPGGVDAQSDQPAVPDINAVPQQLRRLAATPALDQCLGAISAEYRRPLAAAAVVDLARYEGEPAVIVTLIDTSGARTVWVSGPECGISGADTRLSVPAG